MMKQHYYLITFEGTHVALKAEAIFKEMDVKVKVIPLPSVIAAGCGFAIKVLPMELVEVEGCLKQSLFEWTSLYKLVRIGNETRVEGWELF